jgi:hypothetical protein
MLYCVSLWYIIIGKSPAATVAKVHRRGLAWG